MEPELILPDDFDEAFWLIESKGYFVAQVKVGGREVEVTFYDPFRLAQDSAHDVATGQLFIEKRLLVVPRVTLESMRAAVARAYDGFFE